MAARAGIFYHFTQSSDGKEVLVFGDNLEHYTRGTLAAVSLSESAGLEQTLLSYLNVYNHHIPQRALGHKSPVEALKKWQAKRPEIFVKRVYKLAGLDMLVSDGHRCNLPYLGLLHFGFETAEMSQWLNSSSFNPAACTAANQARLHSDKFDAMNTS